MSGVIGGAAFAPAQAQEQASERAAGHQLDPTMVILDASGSMLEDDAGGKRRIDAAKDAVHRFVDGVSDDSALGFMVYGTTVGNSPAEHEAGCNDITVLAPPAPGQADTIREQVDGIEARGYTPMGPALKKAADELPDEGSRSIVLVSDGIDTCAPPPVCEVAKQLAADGIDLVINTVGFRVDPAARAELACIAEAGGGQYLDANDADSLAESLRTITTRQIDVYESDLEVIEGALDEQEATEIPLGTDEFSTPVVDQGNGLGGGEAAQYYRLPVKKGERVIISLVTTPPPARGVLQSEAGSGTVAVKTGNYRCSADSSGSLGNALAVTGFQYATLTTEVFGLDGCEASDGFVFSIKRNGDFLEGRDIPGEVTITRLNGEDVTDVPAPTPASEPREVELASESEQVVPGSWFTEATPLAADGSTSVTASIVPGERHVYSLDAKHGQTIAGAIATVSNDYESARSGTGDQFNVHLINSARQLIGWSHSHSVNSDETSTFGTESPINYRHLSDDGDASLPYLPGKHYLVVDFGVLFDKTEEVGQQQQATAVYELTLLVDGEETPGPTFNAAAASQDTSASASTSEETPPANSDNRAEEDGGGLPMWVWVFGISIIVIIAVAVGAVAALRARS